MARARKSPPGALSAASLMTWADAVGEALGRGMARGLAAGLAASGFSLGPRKRGRPPNPPPPTPVPADRRCRVEGCPRPARSKGLCSAHYQAERRRVLRSA